MVATAEQEISVEIVEMTPLDMVTGIALIMGAPNI